MIAMTFRFWRVAPAFMTSCEEFHLSACEIEADGAFRESSESRRELGPRYVSLRNINTVASDKLRAYGEGMPYAQGRAALDSASGAAYKWEV